MTTAWMWTEQDSLRGLQVDGDRRLLHWFDEPGCHCGDSTWSQPAADFLRQGAPGWVGALPADVAAELQETLRQLQVPDA